MREREKTLTVYAPCCGAKMTVEFDGTGEQWEPSTDLPTQCPRGHALPFDLRIALEDFATRRARDGVGDFDKRDICGHTESQR